MGYTPRKTIPNGQLAYTKANIGANLTASVVNNSAGVAVPYTVPKAGSILTLSYAAASARTAGTATYVVYVNGSAKTLSLVVDGTNPQYHKATQAAGVDTFAAGDRIDVRVTTDSGWLPTSANNATVLVGLTFDA